MSLKKSLQRVGLLFLVAMAFMLAFIATARNTQNQNPIGSCSDQPYKQINSKRSLGLIIQNRKLLALRLDSEGNYSVPGGHVDSGESAEGSLSRELQEELGILTNPNDFEMFRIDCETKKSEKEEVTFFLVRSWVGDITLNNPEDKIKWADFAFESEKKADTDLKLALYYLKEVNLID
jgi:ADP-ribose pyrophosphatase YjhB (NUDIX family)